MASEVRRNASPNCLVKLRGIAKINAHFHLLGRNNKLYTSTYILELVLGSVVNDIPAFMMIVKNLPQHN